MPYFANPQLLIISPSLVKWCQAASDRDRPALLQPGDECDQIQDGPSPKTGASCFDHSRQPLCERLAPRDLTVCQFLLPSPHFFFFLLRLGLLLYLRRLLSSLLRLSAFSALNRTSSSCSSSVNRLVFSTCRALASAASRLRIS